MGFGPRNQEETHRREFESPPGYHWPATILMLGQVRPLARVCDVQ